MQSIRDFAHSIGVMEFASKVFDSLLAKHRDELGWPADRINRNKQLLRLAALLHDTGHPPFSHGSEEVVPGGDHEEFSKKVMLADPVGSILDEFKSSHGIDRNDVAEFFSAENIDPDIAFLREIFSGEMDADKLDYLLRDSHYTGVHYGRFDHERLVRGLCLIPDKNEKFGNYIMAVESGGLHALEGLVLARYFMFTQVYFHRVRRAFDHHLVAFLTKNVGRYPEDLDKYLAIDDDFVINLLKDKVATDEHANAIINRRPYKEAFTTSEHVTEEERIRFFWLWSELQSKFSGLDKFIDNAEKAPHKFEKVGTFVLSRSTGEPVLVVNESGIIKNLQNIEQYRIFVPAKYRDEVRDYCRDFSQNHTTKHLKAMK
ncbi:MAG: HD domain-containing protein [Terriglobia bacterium]|nr:HD domain-containing protein [Terriglobia bacterium]